MSARVRWRGIQGRLISIVALSALAMGLASLAAVTALDRIGEAAETVTGRDVPAMASALQLARIGDRLQQRGAGLMAAETEADLGAARAAIEADLASFATEAQALGKAQETAEGGDWDTARLARPAEGLATALGALSDALDRARRESAALEAERARILAAEDAVRQVIGPSILAIETITGAPVEEGAARLATYRAAVRAQAPLLATERLVSRATAELLLATGAESPQALTTIGEAYGRTLGELDAVIPALPRGLGEALTAALDPLADQSGPTGIFALQSARLDARARARTASADAASAAAALKEAVDAQVLAASRSTAEVTELLRQTIVSRTAQFAILGFGVILIAAGASWLFGIRPMARNLAAVTAAMTRLAAGQRDVEVPGAERGDEIGDLARAFGVFKTNSDRVERLDRQLAERSNLLLTTFESMKDGYSVFDRNGRLVAWNPQYLALYGFDAETLAAEPDIGEINAHLGRAGAKAFLPEGDPVALDTLARLRYGQPQSHELRFADGRVYELRSTPIPQGGFATIHLDVTEERATASQLLHAQKLETVGQLTGGIAHDFNNILAVILGNLNILSREIDPASPLHARAERAAGAASRAAALVNRLLAFSRRQRLAPEDVDTGTLVAGMVDLMQASLGAGVELVTELAPDLPQVRVDPGELENALMNLAVNARDAMEGAGVITVATRPTDGPFVELSVTDTGTGIPPELLDQVFEPFFTTKPVGKGSGLGLSMVYGFVEQSGGSVEIDSAPGRGTTITLRLPVSPAPAPALGDPGEASEACILAVDDDTDLLDLVADQLRAQGWAVVTAPDGETALEMLAEIPEIDLIFTDLAMPGMDGLTLAERARALRPELPVLFTSGAPEKLGKAGVEGLANLLAKPVPEEVLAAAVRVQLEAYSRRTSASNT